MPKESSAQGGRSYCQVHCSSFYQDGPTGLRSGLSNSMTVEEIISMFRKQEEKKKKSKPTWNAGISRPVVMPFLLGSQRGEGLSPQKVTLEMEIGAMTVTVVL